MQNILYITKLDSSEEKPLAVFAQMLRKLAGDDVFRKENIVFITSVTYNQLKSDSRFKCFFDRDFEKTSPFEGYLLGCKIVLVDK